MTPAEGGEAFRRILASATAELLTISTAGLSRRPEFLASRHSGKRTV